MVQVLSRDKERLIDRLSHDYPNEWREFMQSGLHQDSFTFPDGTEIQRVRIKY